MSKAVKNCSNKGEKMVEFIARNDNTNVTVYINPYYVVSAVDSGTSIVLLTTSTEMPSMTFPANSENVKALAELNNIIKNQGSRFMR